MDWSWLSGIFSEVAYALIVLGLVYLWATLRGYWAVARLIVGLYFALVLFWHMPFLTELVGLFESQLLKQIIPVATFVILAIVATHLCVRLIPDEGREKYFSHLYKKFILSLVATTLIIAIGLQVLPVPELVTIDTPLMTFLATEKYFFWILLAPLVVLFFV